MKGLCGVWYTFDSFALRFCFITLSLLMNYVSDIPSVSIVGGTAVKTVPVGGRLKLECQGSGIPSPTIQWSRLQGPIPPGIMVDGGLLFITNARLSHGGFYRCQVTNRVGSVQSQVEVFVQGKNGGNRSRRLCFKTNDVITSLFANSIDDNCKQGARREQPTFPHSGHKQFTFQTAKQKLQKQFIVQFVSNLDEALSSFEP